MNPTPPGAGPDEELVHTLGEHLRSFRLRLGPNTVDLIQGGMRNLYLSGGERHELAQYLAVLVDELAERRRVVGAGSGCHVLVTVDPGRNHGRVSISRGMTPVWAAAGLLRAGEPVEVVRGEYGLTEPEAVLVQALLEDFTELFTQPIKKGGE